MPDCRFNCESLAQLLDVVNNYDGQIFDLEPDYLRSRSVPGQGDAPERLRYQGFR